MVETHTRPIDSLIATYSESHLNPVNEAIHCVCVPAIVFALLGLLWALHPGVALLMALASLAYYLWLSRSFAAGMVLMTAAMLGVWNMKHATVVVLRTCTGYVGVCRGDGIGNPLKARSAKHTAASVLCTQRCASAV
jgi:uncharacterized membrane protein YGL010W